MSKFAKRRKGEAKEEIQKEELSMDSGYYSGEKEKILKEGFKLTGNGKDRIGEFFPGSVERIKDGYKGESYA